MSSLSYLSKILESRKKSTKKRKGKKEERKEKKKKERHLYLRLCAGEI